MSSLSDTSAVRVARNTLAAYDAGGERNSDGTFWSVNTDPSYWAGRIAQALRLVLTAIGDAEGDTP